MLFNSHEFIYLFLPFVLIIFFILCKKKLVIMSKVWLVFASIFFYCWWNIYALPILLISIAINFLTGVLLIKIDTSGNNKTILFRKIILILGLLFNLILLGYFKYSVFFLSNINRYLSTNFHLIHVILPLGISFFTFTQIAFLVDAYKGQIKDANAINYVLFVTFFPHLLAGPIIHHKEMMPQFDSLKTKIMNYKNISAGLFLFSIGLAKKVLIADTFAIWANNGYNNIANLSFSTAWISCFAYSFQVFFDFSGYTDMALGIALMFNIRLPMNFNNPYRSTSIQDFWKRWHITLSRFARDYIYIPLGGSRRSVIRTYINLFITFLVIGFWHGANWTFIVWGGLHGLATTINKIWKNFNLQLNRFISWFITFSFVSLNAIFIRASTFKDAFRFVNKMFNINGFNTILSGNNIGHFFVSNLNVIIFFLFAFVLIFVMKNSDDVIKSFKPSKVYLFATVLLLFISAFSTGEQSDFIYFNF